MVLRDVLNFGFWGIRHCKLSFGEFKLRIPQNPPLLERRIPQNPKSSTPLQAARLSSSDVSKLTGFKGLAKGNTEAISTSEEDDTNAAAPVKQE